MHLLKEVEQYTPLGYDDKIQNICETFHNQNPKILKLRQLDPFFKKQFQSLVQNLHITSRRYDISFYLDLVYAKKNSTH